MILDYQCGKRVGDQAPGRVLGYRAAWGVAMVVTWMGACGMLMFLWKHIPAIPGLTGEANVALLEVPENLLLTLLGIAVSVTGVYSWNHRRWRVGLWAGIVVLLLTLCACCM